MAAFRESVGETGLAVLTCNPRTWDALVGGAEFKVTLDYMMSSKPKRTILQDPT